MLIALFTTANAQTFTIEGTVAGTRPDGLVIKIQQLDNKVYDMIDGENIIVKNNAFTLTGEASSEFTIAILSAEDNSLRPVIVALEPGVIKVHLDTISTVSGTTANDDFSLFNNLTVRKMKKMQEIRQDFDDAAANKTITPELKSELEGKYRQVSEEVRADSYSFLKRNIANGLGEFLFITSANQLNLEQIKELIALSRPQFRDSELIKEVTASLQEQKATDIGGTYMDITLKDPAGKDIKLSDYVGKSKVVLIDFWASWCGPCRKEMPVVVDAYAKYKAKGFEVVGISLDESKDAWTRAIKSMNMTWPQMSDLGGWKSKAATLYNIKSIPATILVDENGKIIAKDLRGDALLSTLESLLGE